jgi:Helix-turn-helix domain
MKPGKARPEQDAKDSFNPYGSIEAWRGVLADPHLSPGAKLAYNDLTYRNRSGHAFPSMKTLARDIAISERQAMRYVTELESEGYIRAEDRWDPSGRQTTNLFRFSDQCAWPPDESTRKRIKQRLPRNKRQIRIPYLSPTPTLSDMSPAGRVTNVSPGRVSDVSPPRVSDVSPLEDKKKEGKTERKQTKADTRLRIAETRDSHADVGSPPPSKPKPKQKPRERTDIQYKAVEEFLSEHLPDDTEEWPGGRADGIPQHWMTQATLDAAPYAHAGEILHFLQSKIDSGWCPPNWQAYPAVVRHEFERRDNRAQGKRWSDADLAKLRLVITRYMEGEEPPVQFEHSCELRANGATSRDVVGLLERRWKNKKYRLGAKHGPGAGGGQRSAWNWFLKVIGNEFSETERAHLPEPPARAKRDESMHASGLGEEQFEKMSNAF